MTATTLLRPNALEGRAVAAGGVYAIACEAAVAAAALENLARTLAVEWARSGVRAVAIVPGPQAAGDGLAALVALRASPGGEYLSGRRFDLR